MIQIQYTEEQIVALGGLLHDIGKLLARCDSYQKVIEAKNGKHQESSKQFLCWLEKKQILKSHPVLEEIVQRHHESYLVGEAYEVRYCKDKHTRMLAYIISRADNYSSKDRREEGSEGKSNYKTRALDCVLAQLKLNDREVSNSNLHYQLRPFSHQNILPRTFDTNTQGELESLIHGFFTDLKNLEFFNFEQLFTGLNTLLQRYTWCIPADTTKKISDVSLYEHLKTTSAFAQCLYRYYSAAGLDEKKITSGDKQPTLAILALDIEGLDEYIKCIATSTKANKRLKGKVAYGNLLKQAIRLKILRELNLTAVCSIWEQDHRVYIVMPNLEQDKKIVQHIIKQVNDMLYKNFDGKLYINSCILPTSGNEVQRFNELLSRIEIKLVAERKYKWSQNMLQSPITRSFAKSVSRCPVCDDNTITHKQQMCTQCDMEIELGTYVEKYNLLKWHFDHQIEVEPIVTLLEGLPQVEFITDVEVRDVTQNPLVWMNYPMGVLRIPASIEIFPSITPLDAKTLEIKTLEDFADAAEGVPYLGVLKCEIKALELLYRYGLIVEDTTAQGDSTSISRLCTINMLLQTFFKGFVQHEIHMQHTKIVSVREQRIKINWANHTVIDANEKGLTLIGPWNEIPIVAKYINTVVEEIKGKNDQIQLYMAMSMLKKKQPMKQGLEEVQNLLYTALEDIPGITLFNTHIGWNQMETVISWGEIFSQCMQQGIISQSFVYRLKNYATQMKSYAVDQNIEHLMYMSHIEYDIGRNLDNKHPKIKEVLQLIRKLYFLDELEVVASKEFKTKINQRASLISAILNYAVYKQRKGE